MPKGRPPNTLERILRRVDRSDENGCWPWAGAIRPDGYGTTTYQDRSVSVHRFLYEHLVGPIPDNLPLDHLCRVRHCCNPDHLEPVTQRENVLRGVGLSAENARKSECKRGHLLTGDNLRIRPDGARQCRQCHRDMNRVRMRAYYARKKGSTA